MGSHDLAQPAGLAEFLQIMQRGLAPCEDWLARNHGFAPAGAELAPRRPFILADLSALNECPDAPLPALDIAPSAAAYLGVLYVIEGSRLGARMLARQLDPALPGTFFADRGRAMDWRGLLALIAGVSPAAQQQLVTAATATFAVFLSAVPAAPTARRAA